MSISPSRSMVIDIAPGDIAETRKDDVTNHRSLFSRRDFDENEIIVTFAARAHHALPNYLTIQVDDYKHIELLPTYLECTNHSCDPNCFFDTTNWQFIALRRIEAGEELTFFYPSTEWEMDRPFECGCGSPLCLGTIRGAKYLTRMVIDRYRCTDFILKKMLP